jgi:geranylgeranyl diphosphate synthase type II
MESTIPATATDLLQRDARALQQYFNRILRRMTDAPPRLIEAIDYSLSAGGKRLRPTLVMECYRAIAKDNAANSAADSLADSSAWAAAAAMELIHTFSLVHDDLPAMDDDDLRRGRPTNHKVFGEAMAILAGDAMVTLAFEVIADDADPALVPQLVRELAAASGVCGMIGGQVLDIDGENQSLALDALQRIHRMKTGALLTASCRLGAIAAGATSQQLAAITEFGRHLGLAFQIVDDVLDVTATPEQMGKATNKDASKGKNTYPALIGLDASRTEAADQLQAAIDAVAPLGERAERLAMLAKFVVDRNA